MSRDAGGEVVARGLRFPEGPIALSDGSLLVVEIQGQVLTHVEPEGRTMVVASLEGGPNGAALGPDGGCYICNNGGLAWREHLGATVPAGPADDYRGGWIERVELDGVRVERLYSHCNGTALTSPNDLVFDGVGGFWFTDFGKGRARWLDRGGVYYARADGSSIEEAVYPMITPNGIGLSADGRMLYVAETETARIWCWEVEAPGRLRREPWPSPHGGRLLFSATSLMKFDSLKIDSNGDICVATFLNGGILVISPDGELRRFVRIAEDWFVTNLCFSRDGAKAWATLSGTGQILAMNWPGCSSPERSSD